MLILPNKNQLNPVTATLSPSLHSWVIFQESLTHRLKGVAGDARLEILSHQFDLVDWWDQQVLSLEKGTVLHREILMWAWEHRCWYARTIIPATTHHADVAFFGRLQNEPLGAMLFNEPKVRRANFVFYAINQQSLEYHWLSPLMHGHENVLWARLSMFMFSEKHPFFLLEIFLPGLMRVTN